DVCSGGNTIASRRPSAEELRDGQWKCIPVSLTLRKPRQIEYRLWTHNHKMALDRIYVFALPDEAPAVAAAGTPDAKPPAAPSTRPARTGGMPGEPATVTPPRPKSIFDDDDAK